MNKLILSLILLILSTTIFAQGIIKGTVVEDETNEPLIGAYVILLSEKSDQPIGAATDLNGYFEIKDIPAGNYTFEASFVGYKPNKQEVKIKDNTVTTVDFKLEQNIIVGPGPIIRATRRDYPYLIDDKLLAQVPAAYDDPARAFTQKLPLFNINDQGNTIAVRGNSPNGLKWYLNNVEIPNPNHTPNAGTAQDRITYSGGGVNMLKPEFLSNTTFRYSGNTNALGGVLSTETDKLINRSPENKRKTAFKIGLIGLEAMTQHTGKVLDKPTKIYLGYRYSTVGLLTNGLGVDFGGEKISFWDYNMNITSDLGKAGTLQLYSVIGSSSNVFEAQRDSSQWSIQKDRFDINFQSFTTITGISHDLRVDNGIFKSTAMLSTWNTSRNSFLLDDEFNRTLLERDSLQHNRAAFHFSYQNQSNLAWSAGLNATYLDYRLENFDSLANFSAIGQTQGWLFEPKVSVVPFRYDHFLSVVTLQGMYYTYNNTYGLQPSLNLKYDLGYFNMGRYAYKKSIQFNYSLQNQIQNPDVYLSRNTDDLLINQSLGFSKAHHFDLAYESKLFQGYSKTTIFYQSLFDIPIVDNTNSSFSVLNDINSFIIDTLSNVGTGRNYGLEFLYEYRNPKEDFYLTFNGSLYESRYTAGDNLERDTRFNGNFIANLTIGQEWSLFSRKSSNKGSKTKQGIIGAYVRGIYAGGMRETPINVAESQTLGRTIFVENLAYSLSQGDIFRIDARFYWRNQKYRDNVQKATHTLAIDIQNVTNRQNVAFRSFDVLQGEVITKNQLGLIPLLSWKVEF